MNISQRVKDALRPAVYTAVFTFIGVFIPVALGWLQDLSDALSREGIETSVSQVSRVPTTTVDLGAETGRKVLKLLDALDEQDDVQNVSANFNIPAEAMSEIGQG